MSLTLTITNADHLDNGEPTQLRLDRHGAVIGRSPQSDWSLPDPKSYISSVHCEIDYRDGAYLLVDKSTNGTFLNGATQRMAAPQKLKDGDVITIGQYRVAVAGAGGAPVEASAPASGAGAPTGGGGQGWNGWGASPTPAAPSAASGWDAPAGDAWGAAPASTPATPSPDPSPSAETGGWATSAAPAPAAAAWGDPPSTANGGWASKDEAKPSDPWAAAAQSGAGAEGWSTPRGSSPAPAPTWDTAASPPGAAAWSEASAAPATSAWGEAGAGPAKPAASGWDPLAPARGPGESSGGAGGASAAPISGRGALSGAWSPPRADTPAAPEPASAAAADVWGAMAASNTVDWGRGGFGGGAPPAAQAATSSDGGWAALLAAAGLAEAELKAAPAQAAATAGALLRRMVAGLVVMMEARARAKAQLGAQSTTLELNGNNPLKFARSPERVLQQLLNPPERGFMGATDAIEDSFRDLQAHQMATLAAMQGALRATLDRFSPEAIRKRAEMRGVLARILPAARNATLWEAYEREFEGVAKSSDEAFMDVFAKAFKEAYERTAAEMKARS